MTWNTRRMAAFDIETTGVDTSSDRIVTAAVSVVGPGVEPEHSDWLVNPGVEIPAGATAVHGITNERARADGVDAATAVEQITARLAALTLEGVPIVAFNARFDLSCLDAEARRYGVVPLVDRVGGPANLLVIDPFVLDKQHDRYRKGKRTLGAMCEHYRVPLHEAHTANADALAAARLAWRLSHQFPVIGGAELEALHALQVTWAAEQAESFEQYLRRQGKDERVERLWPLATPVLDVAPAA